MPGFYYAKKSERIQVYILGLIETKVLHAQRATLPAHKLLVEQTNNKLVRSRFYVQCGTGLKR